MSSPVLQSMYLSILLSPTKLSSPFTMVFPVTVIFAVLNILVLGLNDKVSSELSIFKSSYAPEVVSLSTKVIFLNSFPVAVLIFILLDFCAVPESVPTICCAYIFLQFASEAPISFPLLSSSALASCDGRIWVSTFALILNVSSAESPRSVFPFTVRFPEIVTSSGRPILRLLSEGTDVSISFVVPVIENVSLSKSIVPLPLSPLNKRSFCASTVASTYALIDCWVA